MNPTSKNQPIKHCTVFGTYPYTAHLYLSSALIFSSSYQYYRTFRSKCQAFSRIFFSMNGIFTISAMGHNERFKHSVCYLRNKIFTSQKISIGSFISSPRGLSASISFNPQYEQNEETYESIIGIGKPHVHLLGDLKKILLLPHL